MQIMNNNHQHHHMLNNPYFMNHDGMSVLGSYRMCQPVADYANAQKIPRGNWHQRRNAGTVKETELLNTTRSHKRPNKLQFQNRRKSFRPKKNSNGRSFAPHNTTSYIMRTKKAAGVAPRSASPAVSPSLFSPSAEWLSDLAEREWGVDLYGSMKGLIRIRAPPGEEEPEVCGSDDNASSSTDFSKFEIIWPSRANSPDSDNSMESGVEDPVDKASRLEKENLILKERLSVMDRDMDDMKRRMLLLEKQFRVNINEEAKGNISDDDFQSYRYCAYQERHKSTTNVDMCMDEFNTEVRRDPDNGESLGKVIRVISEKISSAGSELDNSYNKQVEDRHMQNNIGENGLSGCPTQFSSSEHTG